MSDSKNKKKFSEKSLRKISPPIFRDAETPKYGSTWNYVATFQNVMISILSTFPHIPRHSIDI
jgi:hypothetical protein